ncbi:glycosyl transferase [Methanocella sp. CWC-04]|uniref:Glycosyl transferase n=2 Tax=Methanooceanicella nereidis TaxID=2052831 RepID=A0AAP2W792_9EURY|nr:glycosyltransferase family 2 protein [Methanocella sp. CWC-04]MCD1294851.1 glycosyl transferase [Methanocella sp. CWC-04]
MGVAIGSLVYSAIFVASWVNQVLIAQWMPYALYILLLAIILITAAFTYVFIRQGRATETPSVPESRILPITIIIPALNEESTLEQCVESLIGSRYPQDLLEVIIAHEVAPRCRDSTPAIAKRLAEKYCNVKAVPNDGEHSGSKAGSINNCIEMASGEIIGIYDADHVVEKDALIRACAHFVSSPELACIGGKVMVRNMDYNFFTTLVGNEYTVINNFSRFLSELITGTHLIYGSNVFIRKGALVRIGGFDESSLTEDCDLGMKLIYGNYPMKIDYSIRSYEQSAINFRDWWHQRVRWTRGSMGVLKKYMRIYSADTRMSRKSIETILLYSLGTGGLLFSVILIGFMGFMMYMNVITPLILFICCAPLAVLFASESMNEYKEGRGSILDTILSILVRPWVIYAYSLVGVYAVVLDILSSDHVWHENRRI